MSIMLILLSWPCLIQLFLIYIGLNSCHLIERPKIRDREMFVWMVTCMLVGRGVPLSLLTTEEAECYDLPILGILYE